MLVFHPILQCQTLSLAVIQLHQAHHSGLDVQGSYVRSCENISVMRVFSAPLVKACHWCVIFLQWSNTQQQPDVTLAILLK